MQKKLIALAVAGLVAAPAFAQSNVTIYGLVDYGFVSRTGDSGGVPDRNGKSEFASGVGLGSRIGFKGAEDLGNGLKAIFELEYALSVDEDRNKGIWASRHSYVGLTGGFGTVVGGRLDGVRYNIFGKYDAFANGGIGNFTQITGQVDRADNAIAYISPSFSGFTVTAAYSTNIGNNAAAGADTDNNLTAAEHSGNRGDARLNTLMLSYDNGPISFNLDAERVYSNSFMANGTTSLQGVELDERVYTIGGSYDFGMVKLAALYDIHKVEVDGDDVSDIRSWFVSAKAPIGKALVLKATYGQSKEHESVAGDEPETKKFGIGLDYNLSKRTKFYADYGQIKNNSAASTEISYNGNTYGLGNGTFGAATGAGNSSAYGTRGFDLGIQHKF